MSDILLSWLSQEVGLPVEAVEKDFANGYLWGQLFSHFNMQPDFDRFENKRSPDAMVSNYTRLQPTFKRLGINMNTRIANSMMREEAGVALRMLYSIKQNMGQLNKGLQKYTHTGKLGRELGASQEPNRTLLESLQYRTEKQQYEDGAMRFFEETMRKKMPESTKQLMESMYLRRFSEKQYKNEAAARSVVETERAAFVTKRQTFHDTQAATLKARRTDKLKQLDRDEAVHRSLLRRKEEAEREELRVELALAEATRRRQAEAVQLAAQDVTHGIDTFEINMKRLLKGDGQGDEQLTPASTHTPLEHQAKLRAMATSTAKLLEETAGYMASVQAERADDLATKREREARRRRMVVEQQAAAAEAEQKAEAEALMESLARQAAEEQRLAARLWQLNQEKEVMKENRMLREQQYAERRAQDWEQTLRRELELHASMRQQYQTQTASEMTAWEEAQRARAAAKAAKHQAMCEKMAWQLVGLAERAAEYREKTGQLVPRNEWRRWLAMFVANDPELAPPEPQPTEEGPTLDTPLARAAVTDWITCQGEFERDGGAIAPNTALGAVVAEFEQRARPQPTHTPAATIQQLPLKLAVIGGPFSGKTTIAHTLANKHRLRVLDPESLVNAAIQAAKAWTEEQAAAAAAAAAAAPADAQPAGDAEGGEADAAGTDTPLAPPPEPPMQVQLGLRLQAALQAGESLPDTAIVGLVVIAMEETLTWVRPPPPAPEPDASKAKGGKGAAPAAAPKGKGAAAVPEEPPKPAQGFILDGFPRTLEQAVLLEKALTGLDLDAEKAIVDAASRVAPPPEAALPQLQRVLTSGLDAVLVLGLSDTEAALKRALGRRVDPSTGRVYHVEFDPPAASDVGLAARLQEVLDPSNDAVQIQQRMLAYSGTAGPLDTWHKRFSRLRRPIDGAGTLADVTAAADDAAGGVLRAKAAVESCRGAADAAQKARVAAERAREYADLARGHAESAARDLLTAKKAEVQAQALLDGTADTTGGKKDKGKDKNASPPDPAAVELLKAQSAAKCAEALKVCRGAAADAASYAERATTAAQTAADAVDRARASLGDAEVSATAEVDARAAAASAEEAQGAAAAAAAKAEEAKQAADVACQEAMRIAEAPTVEADAQIELAPPAESEPAQAPETAADGAQGGVQGGPVPVPIAAAFLQEWRTMEKTYLDGVAMNVLHMVKRNDLAVEHLNGIRTRFRALLATPDNRSELVAAFQKEFNAVDVDVRQAKETQAELVMRSEELREALWALCDTKMENIEGEKAKVAKDSFISDHTTLLAQYYTNLAQVELDRLFATLTFIKGGVPVKHGVLTPQQSDSSTPAGPVTAPDITTGNVPAELKDKLDEKSKSALPMPAPIAAVGAKSAQLATALKVAYAAAAAAVAALQPAAEGDAKKGGAGAKKDAGKGGKGGAAEDAAADAVPAEVAAAIAADVATLANDELRIVEQRLSALAVQATSAIDALTQVHTSTIDTLSGWIKARYQAECSAVLALDKVIKAAALAGEPLASELRLDDDGTVAIVDDTTPVVAPHPGFPPPRPVERAPPANVLTVAQLAAVAGRIAAVAPGGYAKVGDVAEVLLKAGGEGLLPDGWQGVGVSGLQGALQLLDPTHTGYVEWRQLLASLVAAAFPVIMQATCADMADQNEMLSEGDKDKDGWMSEEEFMSVELWFQYRAFQPGSDSDPEASHLSEEARAEAKKIAFDRATELKKVLWQAFSRPAPEGSPVAGTQRLEFKCLLLYLCADRDLFSGIKKAFSVAAGSIAPNARVDAKQLQLIAYPWGVDPTMQAIHRCPLDADALAKVVDTIYASRGGSADATATISAEQLMYGAHGESVVNQLLHRYQWQDLFVATQLSLW